MFQNTFVPKGIYINYGFSTVVAKKKKGFKVCPQCGVQVKSANLARHMRDVHEDRGGREIREVTKQKREELAAMQKAMKRQFAVVAVIAIVVLAVLLVYVVGLPDFANNDEEGASSGGETVAVLDVSIDNVARGSIHIMLDTAHAPVTAAHFEKMVNDGVYDGVNFYRVEPGFVIQGGPSDGSGSNVEWENTGLLNKKYTLSMARQGDANDVDSKDTGSTEFFVNLDDNSFLDTPTYRYVVFGTVISGRNIVDAIGNLPTQSIGNNLNGPISNVVITNAYMIA